jgi:hypothetical protein
MGKTRHEERTAVSDEGAVEARSTSDQRERSLAVAERRRRKHMHHNAVLGADGGGYFVGEGRALAGLVKR